MKEKLYELIQKQQETLFAMADQIHDDPEYDGEEYHASAMLEDYLEQHGFQVERGLENWPTAFRATWGQGDGGPRIGLLCEYDALRGLGHGCGHHMQGPCICATAIARKEEGFENPFQLVVYGTPAEET
ncbi:MAG: amidohydrolase, partial [Flintibacter sp.]